MDAVLAVITALEKAIITKDALEVSSVFLNTH